MASKKKTAALNKTKGKKKAKNVKTPPSTVGDTANIILSYKSLADPAPAEMESAKQLINAQPAAKILRERPGMLKVSVPSAEKDKAHRDLKKLRKWNVCEEGAAKIKKK